MATLADQASKNWEAYHPMLLSAATLGGSLWRGPDMYAYAINSHWHLDQLYTSIFTLATVLTAFLFTFYTFIITADRGFLSAARETMPFRQTISYTMRAIVMGAILSVATIPILIVQPVLQAGDPWMVYAAVWAATTVWATASFVRAAWLFAIFTSK